MMGMKKRMKRGGTAKKKRAKKSIGGVLSKIFKPKDKTKKSKPDNRRPNAVIERQQRGLKSSNMVKSSKTSGGKGSAGSGGKAKVESGKPPVTFTDRKTGKQKAVTNKNPRTGKVTNIGRLTKEQLAKKREGRMGGGMMKKRMKRGGRAK